MHDVRVAFVNFQQLQTSNTGKRTSSAEMSTNGIWGTRDPRDGTAERGAAMARRTVEAAVEFIDRWNELEAAREPR